GIVGYFNKVSLETMLEHIGDNLKSITIGIIILLLVGSLVAAWLVSGVIPAMIYYGIKLINPTIFLPTALIIAAVVSVATGSSWTTSATIGVALIAIGKAMGLPGGMIAGAVVSGAYFGDKMSPMSDTTNMSAAMAGTPLFTHIRYMAYTTVPTISITLLVFVGLSIFSPSQAVEGTSQMLTDISASFHISPWLFIIPLIVIVLIVKKIHPVVALFTGVLLGAFGAILFQPELLAQLAESKPMNFSTTYKVLMGIVTEGVDVPTESKSMADLFSVGGMAGMLGTIWLIVCAMIFGGVMEAIGALTRISETLLSFAHSIFGLFASTVASCLAINLTASDQYLAIVVPGKMFEKAYKKRGLAPENLSRALEDSGTVTSAIIPWNTCGAYQSSVLGVSVADYFIFAIFNYLSPFMTLLFAAFKIKIRELKTAD
ncbi:MAG: hypothetical protein RLZZ337_1988, partial [Bacteroidota bacterium]